MRKTFKVALFIVIGLLILMVLLLFMTPSSNIRIALPGRAPNGLLGRVSVPDRHPGIPVAPDRHDDPLGLTVSGEPSP